MPITALTLVPDRGVMIPEDAAATITPPLPRGVINPAPPVIDIRGVASGVPAPPRKPISIARTSLEVLVVFMLLLQKIMLKGENVKRGHDAGCIALLLAVAPRTRRRIIIIQIQNNRYNFGVGYGFGEEAIGLYQ